MRLTLHYRGRLKPNGDPRHKHEIRTYLSGQLERFYDTQPALQRLKNNEALVHDRNGATFRALISESMGVGCKLDVLLLSPERESSIIRSGGDIDNRLKTLLDALSIPQAEHVQRLELNADTPVTNCLLEDDALVLELSVKTARLLDGELGAGAVVAVLDVQPIIFTQTLKNSPYW